MHADVAILIVTYNSARQIEECLRSAIEQRRSIRQQIIVVDNASSDETINVIRDKFPEVQLITPGRNLGFAAGVNLAAQHARADYILLLNPDTIVLDHAVDVAVEFARAHPNYGLYGGRTFRPNGSLEPSSCWGMPTLWSLAMFASGLSMVARNNRLLDPESLGNWQRDTVAEVGVITGCFLLVSQTAWKKLSGMDERYFLYGEDVDFSKRAKVAGYIPVICPTARVVHEVGQSSATPIHKLKMLYRGKVCFFRTHYRGFGLTLALFLLLLGVALRATFSKARSAGRIAASDWNALWRARQEWLLGYPATKEGA